VLRWFSIPELTLITDKNCFSRTPATRVAKGSILGLTQDTGLTLARFMASNGGGLSRSPEVGQLLAQAEPRLQPEALLDGVQFELVLAEPTLQDQRASFAIDLAPTVFIPQ